FVKTVHSRLSLRSISIFYTNNGSNLSTLDNGDLSVGGLGFDDFGLNDGRLDVNDLGNVYIRVNLVNDGFDNSGMSVDDRLDNLGVHNGSHNLLNERRIDDVSVDMRSRSNSDRSSAPDSAPELSLGTLDDRDLGHGGLGNDYLRLNNDGIDDRSGNCDGVLYMLEHRLFNDARVMLNKRSGSNSLENGLLNLLSDHRLLHRSSVDYRLGYCSRSPESTEPLSLGALIASHYNRGTSQNVEES
ncbi:hypothetical protein PFISCL1PPCAC_15908, partial [Pristionchus fissidentatus]